MKGTKRADVCALAVAAAMTAGIGLASAQQPTPAPMKVKAGDIAEHPDRYYGKKVTVHAEVEDVLGPQVFLLDEDQLFVWPDVLVIAPRLSSAVPEDEDVTVTGTVRAFVDTEFRRDYNWNWWNDVDADVFVTFRDRPVIVADSIRTDDDRELIDHDE